MQKKLTLAVSACLLGENVRYDGRNKADAYIVRELANSFHFKAICPEVEIGLTVPRPPIQLTRVQGQIQAVTINQPEINFTKRLTNCAQETAPLLTDVCGYIFKSKSPSCGVGTTVLNDEKVNGVFADNIMQTFPSMPIVDESQLQTDAERSQFINAVIEYSKNSINSIK